jgi:fumarate reductase (CoM/CoB) subunit A
MYVYDPPYNKMRSAEFLDCHVLVIGSGGAGVRAAIEASGYGETILLSKTIAGKGGCTTMAEGGYNAVLREEDSCEGHYEDTMKGGAFLNDPALVNTLVGEAPDRMRDLLTWGAVFDVTDCSEVAQRPFGGQRFPRTCYAGDRTGHEMMATLMDRLASSGVEILQEITVIHLFKDENTVTGALGIDRKGGLLAIRSDSCVLATGGGTRIYDISTNSSSGTGDGYALGFRAGADLIDMEQVQFHPTGAVFPYDARGRLVTEAVRGEGGILRNAQNERFMSKYDPERMELSTRDVVSRSIATEILEGRGTTHGGVYLDVTHLSRSQIECRLPVMLEQFLKFGVDIRDEPMEVAPTAHHIMGGLRITPDGQSTVPCLYACGEVAGGVHGANRLGGNALAETQVFGKRAGEAAGKAKKRVKKIQKKEIETQEKRLSGFYTGDVLPTTVARSLQVAMWESAGIFRTAKELEKTLEVIKHLSSLSLKASGESNLAECCTVQNMLTAASLVVKGAMLRKESRGAHVRKDVTQTWDAQSSPYGHTWQNLKGSGIEKGVKA